MNNRIEDKTLAEANELIAGDRHNDYGPATENFKRTADLLNAFLSNKLSAKLTESDVAQIMILVKIARNACAAKRDSFVDIAAYAALAEQCRVHFAQGSGNE